MNTTIENRPNAQRAIATPINGGEQFFRPQFDVIETSEAFEVHADVPGATADNVEIDFERGVLSIHARVRRDNNRKLVRREFGVGDYRFQMFVSEDIDSERIQATVKHGELTVRMPKADRARSRKIAVREG
ncbi:MAG: Hsp20/alpha crystallin family protein [Phycisphaerales bacterium]|nr:Hsp20/alpha crystallin family protein [Phycisphaerales bacterium]